jgi:pilus assembly protein CpaF
MEKEQEIFQAGANMMNSQPQVVNNDPVGRRVIKRMYGVLEEKVLKASDGYEGFLAGSLESTINDMDLKLTPGAKQNLYDNVMAYFNSYGPIQPFIDDPQISEIMVNGPDQVFIERNGTLIETNVRFENDAHVVAVINFILQPLGRFVNYLHPTVDARLPDGSRVNIVIPPVAHKGPCITIRKFLKDKLTMEQLIGLGSITETMADFLRACVVSRLNIIVSGNTSSGKTTLLNILSGFIPGNDRIITIEDAAELNLLQRHVVSLEFKPPNPEGEGAVTIRDLVKNSLRMRPDRIIVGEVRGGEALDMLQAMNTGHEGSLTTVHSNTPRDTISRLETMSLMAGLEIPIRALRHQIASAVHLIVHAMRMSDGTRKVTNISEVVGMEGEVVTLMDLFRFTQKGVDSEGRIYGDLQPTGLRPQFTPILESYGHRLPPRIFIPNR